MLMPLLSSPIDHSSKRRPRGTTVIDNSNWSFFYHRKKFAKLKIQFERKMKDSETLIHEQLRIEDLSKRIQEQNELVIWSSRVLRSLIDTIIVNSWKFFWSSTKPCTSRPSSDTI